MSLYLRIRDKWLGGRDVVTDQVQSVTREVHEEEERRLRQLEAWLPSEQDLASMFQQGYNRWREREPEWSAGASPRLASVTTITHHVSPSPSLPRLLIVFHILFFTCNRSPSQRL